ncbi:MAG: hypothetical protein Q8O29_05455 [Polaromonas sp.]|uniref:hypothetical protein n=1 Tax=Polaromonas sp. TaxID=1869339 RepID=UPI002732BFE3|nr:hypothetical protein [Polaromonas sp.]MDP2817717.1 hypothetical protein [Polaromonas sp.]
MEFLTLAEARERATEIRAWFNLLMDNRKLAPQKNAAQWQFFRLCLDRTLGASPQVPDWRPLQIAQYKFEVENKLRRLYLRDSQPLVFIFRLASRRDARRENLVVDDDYPETGGYHLLVSDRQDAAGSPQSVTTNREHIEMVIAACMDAEFEAYRALPKIDDTKTSPWFVSQGPAHRDLLHSLERVAQRGLVLTNPRNPSTRRLLSINVKEIINDKAVVRTTEYWYLRWWSSIEGKYYYPYRQTTHHTYILKQYDANWLVEEIIRPQPLQNTPHR